MGRRLPDAITRNQGETDEEFADREKFSKRRLQIFKRIYQNYFLWQSLREAGHVGDVLVIEGVDYYLGDLMTGIDTLPDQQRRAFELICLQGYTESAATKIILPKSNWSTPVQQYSDDGLKKMVAAYDAKQDGTWDPVAAVKKTRRPRRKEDTAVSTPIESPEVPEQNGHAAPEQNGARTFSRIEHLDWSVCSEDNQRLADYINSVTGWTGNQAITGQQVKAVAFLRKPWYHSDGEKTHREQAAEAKKAEQAKFAYETEEQRKARHDAARRLRSAEAAAARAKKLQDEVRELRIKAGLDPETGEPSVALA